MKHMCTAHQPRLGADGQHNSLSACFAKTKPHQKFAEHFAGFTCSFGRPVAGASTPKEALTRAASGCKDVTLARKIKQNKKQSNAQAPRMPVNKELSQAVAVIVGFIEKGNYANILECVAHSSRNNDLADALLACLVSDFAFVPASDINIASVFFAELGRMLKQSSSHYPKLSAALQQRKISDAQVKSAKRKFATAAFNSPLPPPRVIDVVPLLHAYPPENHWVCEDQDIYDRWRYHIKHSPQPDRRVHRKSKMIILDTTKLTYDVSPDESIIFKHQGELVVLVMWNFCPEPDGVDWADRQIREAAPLLRHIRVSSFILPSIATLR